MLSVSHSFLPVRTNPPTRFSFSSISRAKPKFFQVLSSSAVGEQQEYSPSPAPGSSPPFPAIKTPKRVVLVRHGQSTWNAEGRIQGSSDFSVLTAKGEAQAETSRQMLNNDLFDVCFSSPLNRSRRTAEIIWDSRKESILTDYELREIDLYSFQGLLKHEGKEKFGDSFRQWQIDPSNFLIDGHYPVRELWARARICWDRVLAHESRSVLVVAHNAVNQALVASAIGLGAEYFRVLLQSNCGVSVLDFTPCANGGSPHICLNRLNQTPSSPIAAGSSAGRKATHQIILVCHGSLKSDAEIELPELNEQPMTAQKTAEMLLDLKINTIVTSPGRASKDTAEAISRVQEAADSLGADCVPRYVDKVELKELDIENILQQSNKHTVWDRTGKAWRSLLDKLSNDATSESQTVVVVGNCAAHVALMVHCLNLSEEWLETFHVDEGSITVIDFPDGIDGRGVIRCINYTAHLGRWSIPITG
ncbi:hypothetical protein V2J09_002750 [Rumex salicifolius]